MNTISPQYKPSEIISRVDHRSWPPPGKKWLFYQEWHNVLFFHWKVDKNELRKYLPDELEIDLFNGQAWVSMIVFKIKNIRPRFLPSVSAISNFDEINIRTYIRYKNREGIYFLNIEAGKWFSGLLAHAFSDLPYRFSHITSSLHFYKSENPNTGDNLMIDFRPSVRYPSGKLDRWLSDRYVFFQDSPSGKINELHIHHCEWPLQQADISLFVMNYNRFKILLPKQPDLTHYSTGVQVLTWGKIRHTPGKH